MPQLAFVDLLLVEDNPGDALLVRAALAEAGPEYRVTHAECLQQALAWIAESPFDAILLDLSLPDATGLETVSMIQEVAPALPIVVLSGMTNEVLALQIVQNGAQDYLIKGQSDGGLIKRAIRYAIQRKHTEDRLAYLAEHDQLTGLPNRNLFRNILDHTIHRARRNKKSVALLFLDLDRFKLVNDTLGHDVGDLLLKQAAERLSACVREGDTVARLGGDEFTVILEDLVSDQDTAAIAQKVLSAMERPFNLANHEVYITTSIGVAVYPHCGKDSNTLIKNADTAMYRAKKEGGHNFQFYTTDMNAKVYERMRLENRLRQALERQEFSLHYQPQVDVHQGHITGVEALLRWEGQGVPTEQVITLAEETGLIVPLGEWVLHQACTQMATWHQAGFQSLSMSINLSPRQFKQKDLVHSIDTIIRETGLNPNAIQLEITEHMFMDSAQNSRHMLAELKSMGMGIAIDDFGIGYSSLNYLKRFAVDTLKIDRSFISGISRNPSDNAIPSAIIALARAMQLKAVAEGVETTGQLDFLRAQGCDEFQGFIFCRAMSAAHLEARLESVKSRLIMNRVNE